MSEEAIELYFLNNGGLYYGVAEESFSLRTVFAIATISTVELLRVFMCEISANV